MLSKAIAITAQAFEGEYDKGGKPYILHCLFVMSKMPKADLELQQIAVMHDLIEDTDYTLEDLKELGFSDRVVAGVALLTHPRWEPYVEYIARIAENMDAVLVKLADLRHNSDITRMKGIGEKDLKRLAKYHKAFKFLKEVRDSNECG